MRAPVLDPTCERLGLKCSCLLDEKQEVRRSVLATPKYAARSTAWKFILTAKIFTLTEDVNVLQSTATDIVNETGKTLRGGGTQYFSPDLKGVTEEVVQ